MKETVTVNIGSEVFILDNDACRALQNYLDDVRSRLPEEDGETMDDIEIRIAEIFRERVCSPMRVVTLDLVRSTIARLGAPSEFGERHSIPQQEDESQAAPPRRLYRSRTVRSIAGICGGLGTFFNADPTMIRLITLLLILFGGLSIWAYIILWIVIPEEPARKFSFNDKRP